VGTVITAASGGNASLLADDEAPPADP